MPEKKNLFEEESEMGDKKEDIPTQENKEQGKKTDKARGSNQEDPGTEGGGGDADDEKQEKKPQATPGKSKARTMTAAEFIRRSRAKERGTKKEPPIEMTEVVIRVAKKTETQLEWAYKNKNFMAEKVTIHVKTMLQQLLYLGTENFLYVMKEVAGKESVMDKLPNTVKVVTTALEQAAGVPWKQMVDLMGELTGEERKLVGQGLLIAADRWKEAAAIWAESGKEVVRWLNAVITQMHEKCLIIGVDSKRVKKVRQGQKSN